MSINIKSPHEYLNATVVGTPTIIEGVVSGFSSGNYLTTESFDVSNGESWERVWKVTTGIIPSVIEMVNGVVTNYTGFQTQVTAAGYLNVWSSSNGSSWDIASDVTGSTLLQSNTDYWIKEVFNGSAYQVYLSTTGEFAGEESLEIDIASTAIIKAGKIKIGAHCNLTYFWSGSIDLNESYIKINGEYWWRGVEVDQYREIKILNILDQVRYYKYVTEYEEWTQPKATGYTTAIDGGNMVISASSENSGHPAWRAMDGTISTSNSNDWETVTSAATWSVKFPYQIKVTGLVHYNNSFTDPRNVTGRFYTDSTMTTPIGDAISTPNTNGYMTTVTGIPEEGVITDTIFFNKTSSGSKYGCMNELKITATKPVTVIEETTADDNYEWYEQNPLVIKQVYKTDKPKYYKYDGGEEPDVNVVGSLSEYYEYFAYFGDGKYFTFDIGTTELSDLVELYLNFTLGYDWSDTTSKSTGILGGDAFPLIQIYNQKVNLGGASALGSHTYSTYEDVKWKIKIQNGVGEIYRLNDNNEYELDYTFDYSTPISGTVRVGWNSSTRYIVSGRVYYDGTYVNVNGKRRWTITKPVNYNKRSFTFPELTSEGSIGGDEYGVVAGGNITGLMNLFQPLVDGKVQTEVYAEFPTSSDGVILYSPIPFCPREFDVYYYLASDGSYIDELGISNSVKATYSDDGVNWIGSRQYDYEYSSEEKEGRSGGISDKNSFHKYWRLSITNISTPIRIGKIVISGYSAEPLTADDDYDYKELIPQLVYEHNPTAFQQSTAGTYTFNVTEEAPYEITLVGGGGGGAFNSSGNAGSAAAGNSGSGLVVNAVLKAGTYVLNVGAGGAWSGWLDANTWGGNGSQSSISKDGVVLATAGGGTGNHCWWRSGSERNSTVGAAPTYTDALGVRDVILNRQGNWGGLAATSSGGASVISGTTWGKGGDTRNRNAADNGNAGCIRIVRLEK